MVHGSTRRTGLPVSPACLSTLLASELITSRHSRLSAQQRPLRKTENLEMKVNISNYQVNLSQRDSSS